MIGFTPVREKPETLEVFLRHIADHSIEWWVYDDNDDPESSALLRDADVEILPRIDNLPPGAGRHEWSPTAVGRVATIKNEAIERFLATPESHLFLLDADVLTYEGTPQHLAEVGPVTSAVYWSKWADDRPWLPNVWDHSEYSFFDRQSIERLRDPGDYEVGGLGACTVIDRRVLEAIRFDPISNLPMPGEDRWFSIRCAVVGVPLIGCTHYTPWHVYSDDLLVDEWTADTAEKWRAENLNDEWANALPVNG